MITTLIVDDNKHNRSALINLLAIYCKDVQIVGEANSIQTAKIAIDNFNPELIFLDIDLGDGSGFELLSKFTNQTFNVVFVTAFDTFAIEAFKINAVDYLLKPINIKELVTAVTKVKQKTSNHNYQNLYNSIITNKQTNNLVKNKIVISTTNQLKFIEIDTIIRCEADGKYTQIILEGGETHTSSKNLKEFEDELPKNLFFRVHHSHLINLKMITFFDKNDDLILMTNQDKVPLAQRKKNEFMEMLTIL